MLDKTELGKRIKKVRETKHLTLKNIEAKAGISATHISEIERGKTSPTLGALVRISNALDKDPAYFVEERDLGDASVVTLENRIQESLQDGAGTVEHLTTSIPGGRLQGSIITLAPGKATRDDVHEHFGQESVLVLTGSVVFTVGSERHELTEGDSISFDAQEPHLFANPSASDPARMLWICNERGVS
jgi:transcriptional regulator with XRE-family HTH domain